MYGGFAGKKEMRLTFWLTFEGFNVFLDSLELFLEFIRVVLKFFKPFSFSEISPVMSSVAASATTLGFVHGSIYLHSLHYYTKESI